MERGFQPFGKVVFTLRQMSRHSVEVIGLDLVIVGLNDRFLGGKVVVSGSQCDTSGLRDFAHCDCLDSALAEESQSRLQDKRPCRLTGWAGFWFIEHVQIIDCTPLLCQAKTEHVHNSRNDFSKANKYNYLRLNLESLSRFSQRLLLGGGELG